MFDRELYMKLYYRDNSKRIKDRSKQRREVNPEYFKKYCKQWYKNNPKYNERYYLEHKEMILENNKKYRQEHKKECSKCHKIWVKNNPEKMKIIRNNCQNKKYRINPKFKLDTKTKQVIMNSLKNNSKGEYWEKLLDYTSNGLKKHLQKTIPNGCCWQDFLDGKLELDHIIPKSAFNYNRIENPDFKRCWSLENLQLLPAKENFLKHNKLFQPFQPALNI